MNKQDRLANDRTARSCDDSPMKRARRHGVAPTQLTPAHAEVEEASDEGGKYGQRVESTVLAVTLLTSTEG